MKNKNRKVYGEIRSEKTNKIRIKWDGFKGTILGDKKFGGALDPSLSMKILSQTDFFEKKSK